MGVDVTGCLSLRRFGVRSREGLGRKEATVIKGGEVGGELGETFSGRWMVH